MMGRGSPVPPSAFEPPVRADLRPLSADEQLNTDDHHDGPVTVNLIERQ